MSLEIAGRYGAGFVERPGFLMVVAMWTEPERRGEGLGGRVLDAIVDMARSLGLRAHLFVMLENPEAAVISVIVGIVDSIDLPPIAPSGERST